MQYIFVLVGLFQLCFIHETAVFALIDNQQSQFVWENKVYKNGIKTALIYKKGWELSMPVIELNSDAKLSLVFDEITTLPGNYFWEIIHCNSNWQQSEIESIEYISGQNGDRVSAYDFSQNTMVNYINYHLDFPTQECKPTVSGNYIIKVFEDDNREKLVLTRRFYVYEPLTDITANVEQLTITKTEGLNQRLNFTMRYDQNKIENPFATIRYKILKNNSFETDFENLKPSAINGNVIRYENLETLLFAGGNEYRHFSLKSVQFLSDRLKTIEKEADAYHIFLITDFDRSREKYNFENDIDGLKLITLENCETSNIMADYCFVQFELDEPLPLEKGDFYIFGAISDWTINEQFKMKYNFKTNKFEKNISIKQGYYNYHYLFITDDKFYNSEYYKYKIEGNYFQTENDYHIFIYYRSFSENYDRLVGYTKVNSLKKGDY